jgi:hypothetical protein
MITIRRAQREAMAALPTEEDLVAFVVDHVREYFPGRFDELEEFVTARVRRGIARARSHGLAAEEDLCSFVTVMLDISARFDEQPRIARILGGDDGTPTARYARLFAGGLADAWEEAARYPAEDPDAELEAWEPGALAELDELGIERPSVAAAAVDAELRARSRDARPDTPGAG